MNYVGCIGVSRARVEVTGLLVVLDLVGSHMTQMCANVRTHIQTAGRGGQGRVGLCTV